MARLSPSPLLVVAALPLPGAGTVRIVGVVLRPGHRIRRAPDAGGAGYK